MPFPVNRKDTKIDHRKLEKMAASIPINSQLKLENSS